MNKDLTVGRPESVLWRFCLPLFGSVIFQQLYNIADSFVAGAGSTLTVHEKIMTTGDQHAITDFAIDLNGENCSTDVVSRSVARDHSKQEFRSSINGNNACAGHSECDAIIMDKACVIATPALTANHVDAALIHEAAIGKIAGEQIIKLMTLGLTEEEAEREIVNGFLK